MEDHGRDIGFGSAPFAFSEPKPVFTTEPGLGAIPGLIGPKYLRVELWREYDFAGRTYRIEYPLAFYYRDGGSTHRVVDTNGIVHCVPAPGVNGCVLRWKNKSDFNPVGF